MREKKGVTLLSEPAHALSPKPSKPLNTPLKRRPSFFLGSLVNQKKPATPERTPSPTTTTNLSSRLAQGNWTHITSPQRHQNSPASKITSAENIFMESAAEMKLPFSEEYRLLNKIVFHCQQKNQRDSEEILFSFVEYSIKNEERLSAIGKKVYDQIKIFFKEINNDDFSEILKNEKECFKDILKSTIQTFLEDQTKLEVLLALFSSGFPKNYISKAQIASTAEKNFPSSVNNRIGDRFSHFLENTNKKGGIIATDVPHQGELGSMDSFLEILWNYNVGAVYFIGSLSTREKYTQTKSVKFETKPDKNNDAFTLSRLELGSVENKVIIRQGFSAEDQHSLALKEEDLKNLLDLHALSKTKVVAIHCDSGVGRTGELILLLRLLDLYESDRDFSNSFNSLLNHITEQKKLSNGDLKKNAGIFFKHAGICLSKLRETRYFVEKEKQFSDVLPLLMKVVAYQKEIAPEKRAKIDALLPATKAANLGSPNLFGEVFEAPPSSSDSQPLSSRSRHSLGSLLASPATPFLPRPPSSARLKRQESTGSARSANGLFRGLRNYPSVGSQASDGHQELKQKPSVDSLVSPRGSSRPPSQ